MKRNRIQKFCLVCNKEMWIKPFDLKRGMGKHCSIKCRGITYSKVRKGNGNSNWKGGKRIRQDGYILIYKPEHPFNRNGYVMEHRLKMEEYLERYLTEEEVIHHINGDKSNNFIGNLMLLDNQKIHASIHMKELVKYKERDNGGKFI